MHAAAGGHLCSLLPPSPARACCPGMAGIHLLDAFTFSTQDARPLAVHKAAAAAGSRRQRGVGAWVGSVAEVTALPEGQAGAELAVVLEFLQVRGTGRWS